MRLVVGQCEVQSPIKVLSSPSPSPSLVQVPSFRLCLVQPGTFDHMNTSFSCSSELLGIFENRSQMGVVQGHNHFSLTVTG